MKCARLPVSVRTTDFTQLRQAPWKTHAAKQPVGTRRQRFPPVHRQKKAAVELRRGDLAYRPPPWHLLFITTAEELHTPDMIKVLDSQACSNSKVQLAIDIVPVGAGYFLNGTAAAELPLQCDCCLATFYQPLQAPFKVWLDASLNANDMPEDPCQLPFPPEMQAVDLGPVVNDAIMLALPNANLCGQPDCSIRFAEVRDSGQTTGWSAGPSEQQLKSKTKSTAEFKRSGHFAALQKLKSKSTR